MRLIGGHELLGAWNLEHAVQLNWSPGDVWTVRAAPPRLWVSRFCVSEPGEPTRALLDPAHTRRTSTILSTACALTDAVRPPAPTSQSKPVELPVDGVFVYKYYRANTTGQPVAWQQGNNQILTLSRADAPMLEVQDNWRGDPAAALTCAPDGSRRMQAEVRLVTRVRDADRALIEAQQEIAHLTEELRHARLQTKALREEARLGANVRLALKDQLRAEKKRSTILEQQVDAWRAKALAAKEQAAGSGATAIPGAGAAGMKGDQKQVEAGKPQQAKAEGAAPGAKAEAQPAGNKASNGAAGAPKQAATTSKAESA